LFAYKVSTETLMCDIRFLIMKAMPRARGRTRLNIGPPSIRTSVTTRSEIEGARRAALRLIAQKVERFVGVLAANQIGQRTHLAGADACEAVNGLIGHDSFPSN
jgi:hypothetical protein